MSVIMAGEPIQEEEETDVDAFIAERENDHHHGDISISVKNERVADLTLDHRGESSTDYDRRSPSSLNGSRDPEDPGPGNPDDNINMPYNNNTILDNGGPNLNMNHHDPSSSKLLKPGPSKMDPTITYTDSKSTGLLPQPPPNSSKTKVLPVKIKLSDPKPNVIGNDTKSTLSVHDTKLTSGPDTKLTHSVPDINRELDMGIRMDSNYQNAGNSEFKPNASSRSLNPPHQQNGLSTLSLPEGALEGPEVVITKPNDVRPQSLSVDNLAFSFSRESLSIQDNAETVVSFVIRSPNNGAADRHEECEQNGYIWTMLLSTLYAVVLILVGIALPLSEALRHEWLTDHEVGVFLAYLFSVSSIFLIFLQVSLHLEQRKERQHRPPTPPVPKCPRASPVPEASNTPENHLNGDPSKNPIPKDMLLLRLRKMDPIMRIDSAYTSQDNASVGGMSESLHSRSPRNMRRRQIGFPPSPQPGLSPNMWPRQRHDLPRFTFDGASLGPEDGGDSSPESARGQVFADMESISMQDGDWGDLYEDDMYEQYVLLQQTATLTHEGASFYLRLGCLLFGVGNLVFVCLEIHTLFYSDEECRPPGLFYPRWFQLVFLLVQTFFLFKHTNIHVKRHKGLVRFGLLHVLATNLCIWLRVLTWEVVEAFESKQKKEYAAHSNDTHKCESLDLLHDFSPYLSPFVLEYSLIAVAAMAGMFHSLNVRINTDLLSSLKKALQHTTSADHQPTQGDNQEAFFAKSHKGLYLGVLLLSGTIISIIIFFFNLVNRDNFDQAVVVFYTSDIILHVALLVAVIGAIAQIRTLKVTFNRDNTIDDVLMMVSLSGQILLHVFILIASTSAFSEGLDDQNTTPIILAVVACLLNIIQGLAQTVFVMDGLQRCAKDRNQQQRKLGRGLTTFLIISNVALWIFKTFQVKELSLTDIEQFYGPIAWPVILNICLPLLLFYRFHSSVCLADIWVSAYKMETGPKYMAL